MDTTIRSKGPMLVGVVLILALLGCQSSDETETDGIEAAADEEGTAAEADSSSTEQAPEATDGTAEGSIATPAPTSSTAQPATTAVAGQILGEPAEMSLLPQAPTEGYGTITIDAVEGLIQLEGEQAGDGLKFIVVHIQVLVTAVDSSLRSESDILEENAFRVKAEGEWYSPTSDLFEPVEVGEVVNTELVFVVPESTQSFVIEAGVPAGSPEGSTATFEVTF